jgi:hypothetical protein
MVIPWTHEHL